jgi:hypothetical protein
MASALRASQRGAAARALVLCAVLGAAPVCSGGNAAASRAFDLQGHRGARGLAPENTLAGFRRALAELRRYDVGRLDPATQYGRDFPEQDMDVDGIITDYPDRLRHVMEDRQMALPLECS